MQKTTQSLPGKDGPRASADRIILIVQRLEEDIGLGRLRPRERLVEEDLALRFAAKRHEVRQALAELDAMGIVVRRRNKGALVRDFSLEEVENIYSVRELIEGKAAEIIPLPNSVLVSELRRIHKTRLTALQKGDLGEVFRGNLLFHKTLYRACGNPSLAEAIEIFALKTHAVRSLPNGNPKLLARVTAEHAAIIDALARCDRAALVRRILSHLLPARIAYSEIHAQLSGEQTASLAARAARMAHR
jgi:DNA-binding GntR family transcriptional regulator